MTQEEALAKYQQMFPDRADYLQAEYCHVIGVIHGHMDTYNLWDFSDYIPSSSDSIGLTTSSESWEDAFALLLEKQAAHV